MYGDPGFLVFLLNWKRPSVTNAKVRLYNLDSIRAPGKAQISVGLNAYKKADRVNLESRFVHTNFPTSTVEKICRRQEFICPTCEQSLCNGEDIEIHHLSSLKNLSIDATSNTQVKIVALHKLCHLGVHAKLRKKKNPKIF